MNYKANLNTDVNITPSRSQVVLVALIAVICICFLVGFFFLWEEKDYAWVPLSIGLIIVLMVLYAWFKAQKDTDLEHASPTTLTDAAGNAISTDSRALMSPVGIQAVERIYNLISHRVPLPRADGVVDSSGKPVPNTEAEANTRVDKVNSEAQEIIKIAADELGLNIQPHVSHDLSEQPIIDEPKIKDIADNNVVN